MAISFALRGGVRRSLFVFEIRRLAETDSTNDDAQRVLGEPGSAGLVMVTDFQRKGKGRRERSWTAPPDSALLFTAILPRTVSAGALWCVPYWTALAVAEGIERASDVRVDLQWPNDLLLDRRKCGGILCVSRVAGDDAWIGCGVGLNVIRPAVATAGIEPEPAFLSERAPGIERDALLDAILGAFAGRLDELDFPDLVARRWEERAGLAGTPYRLLVDGESEPFDAVAQRLAHDGSLVVSRDGNERAISLADARVIRP
jgi:BirA family biotin operon repressor/biotin-[acetyl-CoA-carboxylase] ligase